MRLIHRTSFKVWESGEFATKPNVKTAKTLHAEALCHRD